jgi:hypothetical protein
MRKAVRFAVLVVAVLMMPAANAVDLNCVPGDYIYYPRWGWKCTFMPMGTQCVICSAEITVEG